MTSEVLQRRRSPLGPLADELAAAGDPATVTFVERPFRVQVELRTAPGDSVGRLAGVLGLPLPAGVGAVARAGERHALCLGPGWWLVTDAPEQEARLECALGGSLRAAGGAAVSAVDVSAQRTTIDVTGRYARDVFAHGCALDLHPPLFPADRCAQTALAKAQVVLQRLPVDDAYRVHVRASFATYLAHWLLDAAVEYTGQGLHGYRHCSV